MEGVVVGGNIRCLLKLAGTPYFPDCRGKLLFLESRSGGPDRVAACLAQLRQMGVFSQISGLLLGTFSQMEKTNQQPAVPELVLAAVKNNELPIAATRQVGHGADSPVPNDWKTLYHPSIMPQDFLLRHTVRVRNLPFRLVSRGAACQFIVNVVYFTPFCQVPFVFQNFQLLIQTGHGFIIFPCIS